MNPLPKPRTEFSDLEIKAYSYRQIRQVINDKAPGMLELLATLDGGSQEKTLLAMVDKPQAKTLALRDLRMRGLVMMLADAKDPETKEAIAEQMAADPNAQKLVARFRREMAEEAELIKQWGVKAQLDESKYQDFTIGEAPDVPGLDEVAALYPPEDSTLPEEIKQAALEGGAIGVLQVDSTPEGIDRILVGFKKALDTGRANKCAETLKMYSGHKWLVISLAGSIGVPHNDHIHLRGAKHEVVVRKDPASGRFQFDLSGVTA